MISSSESRQYPDDFTDVLGAEGGCDQLVQYLHDKLIKLLNPTCEACIGKAQNAMGFEERFPYCLLQFCAAVFKMEN